MPDPIEPQSIEDQLNEMMNAAQAPDSDMRPTYSDLTNTLTDEQKNRLVAALDNAVPSTSGSFERTWNNKCRIAWARFFGENEDEAGYWKDMGVNDRLGQPGTKPNPKKLSKHKTRELGSAVRKHTADILSACFKQGALLEFRPSVGARDGMGAYQQMQEKDYYLMARYVEQVIKECPEIRTTMEAYCVTGLVTGTGFLRVESWKPPDSYEVYTDKSIMEVGILRGDPSVTIESYAEEPSKEHLFGVKYHLNIRRTRDPKTLIQYVPSSRILYPEDCVTFDQNLPNGPAYMGQLIPMSIAEMRRQHPSLADLSWSDLLKDSESNSTIDLRSDPIEQLFSGVAGEDDFFSEMRAITPQSTIAVMRDEYIRIDLDGSGREKLLNVRRIGTHIFHIAPVPRNPFISWKPSVIPGRAVGLGLNDHIGDIQDMSEKLARDILNLSALASFPRSYVNAERIERGRSAFGATPSFEDFMDSWSKFGIGELIAGNGSMNDVLGQIETNPAAASHLMQVRQNLVNNELSERTGITPALGNMEGHSVGRTATGMYLGQVISKKPIELIADNFADSIGKLGQAVLRTEVCHASKPMQIKSQGQWYDIDPRYWQLDMLCSAHVSGAILHQEERLTHLTGIYQMYQELIATLGADNPMVGLDKIRNVIVEIIRTMQFSDESRFINDVSPEQIQEMAQRMLEMQQDGKEAAKMKELELKEVQMQREHELALMKLQQEGQIQIMKIAMESGNKEAQMKIEAMIAGMELDVQERIADKELKVEEKVGMDRNKKSAQTAKSSVRPGGDKTG